MIQFSKFEPGDWKLFGGNLFVFLSGIFYSAGYFFSAYPDFFSLSAYVSILFRWALIFGGAALVLLVSGFSKQTIFPVWYIFAGAFVCYILLLKVTQKCFGRPLPGGLLILLIWATFEISVLDIFLGRKRIRIPLAIIALSLIFLAVVSGIYFSFLNFSLELRSRFIIEFVSTIFETAVVLLLLIFQAVSVDHSA